MPKSKGKIKVVKPEEFLIRISAVGTNTRHVGFKKYTNSNALALSYWVSRTTVKEFVGEKQAPGLSYYLACMLLKFIKYDKEKLAADIENAESFLELYEMLGTPPADQPLNQTTLSIETKGEASGK